MILNEKKYPFSENPYPILLVDLTKKCDLNCNVCYARNMEIEDINTDWFERCVSQLPNKNVYFMLLGGEPTVSPSFFKCVEIIHKYGHSAFICTNGLRISRDEGFVKKLSSYNKSGNIKFHIDMSGGLQPDLYDKIHGNSNALEYKLGALKNIRKYGMGKVSISMVLIENVNDIYVDDIFKIAYDNKDIVMEIFFRPQVKEGAFIEEDSTKYTINRTINLLLRKQLLTKRDLGNIFLSGMTHEKCNGQHCCFKILKDGMIIGFYNLFGQPCWQRGRIVNNRDYIRCYTSDIIDTFKEISI